MNPSMDGQVKWKDWTDDGWQFECRWRKTYMCLVEESGACWVAKHLGSARMLTTSCT